MTRADLEAAAEEKYPPYGYTEVREDGLLHFVPVPNPARVVARAAYIQGRLDQAEADARIARSMHENEADGYYGQACFEVAAAIRKGVE